MRRSALCPACSVAVTSTSRNCVRYRIEFGPRPRQRCVRRQLTLARRIDVGRERGDAIVEPGNAFEQRGAFLIDPLRVLGRLRRLALQRFAPRQRRSVLGLEGGELAAHVLRLRTKLFQLQLATVKLRTKLGGVGSEHRRFPRGRSAQCFVALQFHAQCIAFGPARSAGAKIRQYLQIAHARSDAAIPLGSPQLRIELGNAPLQLGEQIVDAYRVLLGSFEPAHRFLTAR